MKIKTKLTLGVGLLFFLIALLALMGIRQVNSLASDTENILEANYISLDFSRKMLKSINNLGTDNSDYEKFEGYLKGQQNNITEVGEGELTDNLTDHYNLLKQDSKNQTAVKQIRNDLNDIMKLNMDAIKRKSEVASQTADDATLWIGFVGTACFLIAFTLLLNLPSNIADPIQELSESIKQIAAKNYSQRVHFEAHNEFGDLAKSFNIMAEKLQEYSDTTLAKIMTQKKRIETLINNMNDPVIGLDENNIIIFSNEELQKISGLKESDLIGKPAQEVSLSNDLIRSLIRDLLLDNKNIKSEEPLKIYADGKESYFEKEIVNIFISPTGETEKKKTGSVIILRNVTAYKELDFAKTNFIATVSHEFKTPIASMKMSLQLLEKEQIGSINEEQKNLLHSINDDADRLLHTTSELLNITQVETGKAQLNIVPCQLQTILKDAIEGTLNIAEQKNIKIKSSFPEIVSPVMADQEKTTWIVSNLISNAIRYSYEHSIIFVSIIENKDTIQIQVKDTGQGIASQYKDKIFDKYFRVPGLLEEGTGLGLAISKEFIEVQGGTIHVESEFGTGSTFSITLKKVDSDNV